MNCEISARCFAVEPLQPINFRAFLTYIPYSARRPHMLLCGGGHSTPVGVPAVGCPPGAGRDGTWELWKLATGGGACAWQPPPSTAIELTDLRFVHHPVQGQHH